MFQVSDVELQKQIKYLKAKKRTFPHRRNHVGIHGEECDTQQAIRFITDYLVDSADGKDEILLIEASRLLLAYPEILELAAEGKENE